MKRFDKALSDFDTAIRLNSTCALGNHFNLNDLLIFMKLIVGYMGKADCLRFMSEYEKAVNLYTLALEKEEIIANVAILKRAITYIEAK